MALLLFAGLIGLTGCGNPTSNVNVPERMQRGYIFYCDGAGGGKALSNWAGGVRQGLREAGYPGGGEMFSWETGLGVGADQVASVEYKRDKAAQLASRIQSQQRQYPQAPINLIGLSAGTVIAVFALEALPPTVMVNDVVLLSGSLSATHDLTPALRHVRGRMYITTSENDAVLKYLMVAAGTADRRPTEEGSLGVNGPRMPAGSSGDARAQYAKITIIPWTSEFLRYGNAGGHTDTVKPEFVRVVVAPIVMPAAATSAVAERAAADDDKRVTNPDYARWANFSPGAWTLYDGYQVVRGERQSIRVRAKLVSKSANRLIVDRELVAAESSQALAVFNRRYIVSARIDPREHPLTHPQSRVTDLPPQSVVITGRRLECAGKAIRVDSAFAEWGSNVDGRVYTDPSIPGGIARITLSATMDGEQVEFAGTAAEFGARPM